MQRARLSNQNVNGDEGASGHWRRSLQDAGKAVYTDSSLLSGYTLKAAALQGLGRWQEAERELQVLLKQGAVVLCNQSAAFMGVNKPIPALGAAQKAGQYDPSNWKAHWRTGLAIMMMQPRLERSEQAISAFERVLALGDKVPAADQQNAKEALNRAKYRLEQGRDALDMPDMSGCIIA